METTARQHAEKVTFILALLPEGLGFILRLVNTHLVEFVATVSRIYLLSFRAICQDKYVVLLLFFDLLIVSKTQLNNCLLLCFLSTLWWFWFLWSCYCCYYWFICSQHLNNKRHTKCVHTLNFLGTPDLLDLFYFQF